MIQPNQVELPEEVAPTIKAWTYAPRADMAADIRDVIELVKYLKTLEMRVITLEREAQRQLPQKEQD